MPVYRIEVTDLILIESIRFAFFVIDLNFLILLFDIALPRVFSG